MPCHYVLVRSYRSLVAWQKAHAVAGAVLKLTASSRSPSTWAVFDQLRRAAISVEANIVEGYALGTAGLFRRHVRIALGSAAEVECLLRLAVEQGLLSRKKVASVTADLDRLFRVLRGLMLGRSPK
ncbi:MAG: four helix bundle protein [Gemmatimonadetes bacterium]|nr:MAG: four helix bundle protein [Gemmatimonadota bacterium]